MPAQTPWYRLLLYFALGFGAAAGLVLLCEVSFRLKEPGESKYDGELEDEDG